MPNWCLNTLTVKHDDKAALDRFVNAYNEGRVCNEFIPEPKAVTENTDINDPMGWYTWRLNNWGVKWDFGYDKDGGSDKAVVTDNAYCTFHSAWAPPLGLYTKLVDLGYDVEATYFEPGMAFCGIWDNGVDDYLEYHSKDMIPKRIWDDYGLDDFFTDDDQ